MAATVSSVWANKPGAWALDAEEHEEELKREIQQFESQSNKPELPSADFPSLATAATATKTKKKKAQTLSLADFNKQSSFKSTPQRLTHDEILSLPTAPRQRSADESDGGRLGGGFRNYGGGSYRSDSGNRSRVSERGEGYDGNSSRGGDRDTDFSRADESDDWSKTKKSSSFGFGGSNGGSERRDRGGFFNSSRADEVDNWGSNKSFVPSSDGRRERRSMGFESNGGGADSDNWGKKKEEREASSFATRRSERSGSGFESERRVRFDMAPGAGDADSENWLKKKEEKEVATGVGNGRPRLNLQPRTVPVPVISDNGDDNNNDKNTATSDNNGQLQMTLEPKPKASNPFGAARPREEVLAEKGKDWKEIDEKLEAMKVKELSFAGKGEDGAGFRRRGFGLGRTDSGNDREERSWRKHESDGPASAESATDYATAASAPAPANYAAAAAAASPANYAAATAAPAVAAPSNYAAAAAATPANYAAAAAAAAAPANYAAAAAAPANYAAAVVAPSVVKTESEVAVEKTQSSVSEGN